MPYNAQDIGDNIRAERSRRNMSQEELAKAVGASPASITNWENGTNAIGLDKACRLADFFGITLDELARGNIKNPA